MVQKEKTIGSLTNPPTNVSLSIFDISKFSQNSSLYIQTFNVKRSKLQWGEGGSEPNLSVQTFCVHTSLGGKSSQFWTMSIFLLFFFDGFPQASILDLATIFGDYLSQPCQTIVGKYLRQQFYEILGNYLRLFQATTGCLKTTRIGLHQSTLIF